MPEALSLQGINPYMSCFNDPYFLYALNSGYANQGVSFRGQTGSTDPSTAAQQASAAPTAAQPQNQPAQPKKKGRAGKVLGGIALVGAAVFCVAAARKGQGANVLERIKNGSGEIFKGIKGKITSAKPSITRKNNIMTVQLPGKKNIITGTADEITAELSKIGENFTPEELSNLLDKGKLKKGNQVSSFVLNLTNKKGNLTGNTAVWSRGENGSGSILKILDKSGKDVTSDFIINHESQWNAIKAKVGKISSGQITKTDELKQLILKNTNAETGLVSRVRYNNKDGNITSTINSIVSDKFHLNHKSVLAMCDDNPTFADGIKAFTEGKIDKLNVVQAKVKSSLGTFNVDGNGNILSLIKDGKTILAGSEEFKALHYQHKDLFEAVSKSKDKWFDKVFQL